MNPNGEKEQGLEQATKPVIPLAGLRDEDLVEHILKGEVDAYEGLMRRYNQRMFRIARSIVKNDAAAMDIVQEAHIKAYYKLADFKGLSSFKSWLYAITRNEALMFIRKFKKEQAVPNSHAELTSEVRSNDLLSVVTASDITEKVLENKQLQKLINQYVDNLQNDFREVFVLRGIEQLSVRETAEILEVEEATVKTRYFRAKKLMREDLQLYLDAAGVKIYEFGGHHCDKIVATVLAYIKS